MTSSRARVQLRVLGPARASRLGDREVASFLTRPRPLGVLTYLALAHPYGMHARETIIAMLWPESDQERGRHALRSALHSIRQTLGDDLLVSAGDGLVGVRAERLECDALLLRDDLAAGRHDVAVARYEGELLQGFHLSGAPAFERWLDVERRRMHDGVLHAARLQIERYRRADNLGAALHLARHMCTVAPDDEPTLRRLLALLLEAGDRAAAVREYEAFAARLRAEFEVEPDPETAAYIAAARGTRGHTVAAAPPVRASARPTRDSEAYVLYVRGHYLFLRAAHGGHLDDLQQSRVLFEQALERDPGFALAYAGLSNYFAVGAARNVLRPFRSHFDRALELSRRTLELDPTICIPHVHFGVKAMYLDSDWDAAGREFGRAVLLDPLYAEARRFHGIYLGVTGRRTEGIRDLREAARIEPLIAIYRNALAAALMDEERYDEAIEQLGCALELDPGYGAARDRLVRCHERMGRYDDAVTERARRGGPDAGKFGAALRADGEEGYLRARAAELREMIRQQEERALGGTPENAGDILNPPELRLALACAELGEWDRAGEWEDRACRSQPGRRRWFSAHPSLAPLHAAARAVPG